MKALNVTRERINALTNIGLEEAVTEVQGIISRIPCSKDGGLVVKHFRYRNGWTLVRAKCTKCGAVRNY